MHLPALDGRTRTVMIIFAIAFAARAWLALLPQDELVARLLPDDAFYYLQIARNLTSGNGVTFDGEVTTNGFHPLWLVVVSACYLLPSDEASLRMTLVAGSLIGAIGCVPLYSLVHRHTQAAWLAALGALLYALHPAAVLFSVNGLESAAVMTALLFCLDAFHRQSIAGSDGGGVLYPGIASGMLILARTDYAFVVVALFAFALIRSGPRYVLRAGSVAAAVVAPWLVTSFALTGSIIQTSGEAVPIVAHGNGPERFDAVAHGAANLRDAWLERIPEWYFGAPALQPLAFAMIIIVAGLIAVLFTRPSTRPMAAVLLAAGGGLIALTVAHASVRWYFREWYVMPIVPVALLALLAAVHALPQRIRPAAAGACVAAWSLLAGSFAVHEIRDPQYEIQADMLAGARWIETHTPESTVAASFNAGIVGYYSGRETVNLDGVVDGDALDAVKDKQLMAYLAERCVTHVAEFPFYLFFYDDYWGGQVGDRLMVAAAFDEAIERQPESIANAFTVWRFTADSPCRAEASSGGSIAPAGRR